jgi:hypothetical protein
MDRRGGENQATLISLGIPKLVRFHKIRPDDVMGITIPIWPVRRVEELPTRCQRALQEEAFHDPQS